MLGALASSRCSASSDAATVLCLRLSTLSTAARMRLSAPSTAEAVGLVVLFRRRRLWSEENSRLARTDVRGREEGEDEFESSEEDDVVENGEEASDDEPAFLSSSLSSARRTRLSLS
jgi:hypothetical protein